MRASRAGYKPGRLAVKRNLPHVGRFPAIFGPVNKGESVAYRDRERHHLVRSARLDMSPLK